jgi:hypothetical protein
MHLVRPIYLRCLVLSFLALTCLVSSCLVLSCLVLSVFVLVFWSVLHFQLVYRFAQGPNLGNQDMFVARFSSNGAMVWGQQFGSAERDSLSSLHVFQQGIIPCVIVVGDGLQEISFQGEKNAPSKSALFESRVIFISSLDARDGKHRWSTYLMNVGGKKGIISTSASAAGIVFSSKCPSGTCFHVLIDVLGASSSADAFVATIDPRDGVHVDTKGPLSWVGDGSSPRILVTSSSLSRMLVAGSTTEDLLGNMHADTTLCHAGYLKFCKSDARRDDDIFVAQVDPYSDELGIMADFGTEDRFSFEKNKLVVEEMSGTVDIHVLRHRINYGSREPLNCNVSVSWSHKANPNRLAAEGILTFQPHDDMRSFSLDLVDDQLYFNIISEEILLALSKPTKLGGKAQIYPYARTTLEIRENEIEPCLVTDCGSHGQCNIGIEEVIFPGTNEKVSRSIGICTCRNGYSGAFCDVEPSGSIPLIPHRSTKTALPSCFMQMSFSCHR